jgi:hypothetical protein
VGPTGFAANVNPLTGLIVADPAVLERRSMLVKVSNEGPVIRPQSGWSLADHIWEHQMEGFAQTRFSAIFLSQTPERAGSVRSARLPDVEHLVEMYGAIFVFSGASSNWNHNPPGPPRVTERIRQADWFERALSPQFMTSEEPYFKRIPDTPRAGTPYYHTLFASPADIWAWATGKGFNTRQPLDGLLFDFTVPPGGAPTTSAVIDYPGRGPKHSWSWDAARGLWLSATDDAADEDSLFPGVQVGWENVVIVKVPHYQADFLEQEGTQGELYSVGFQLTGEGDAILLRDGMRYEVKWRRGAANAMIQFFDAAGNLIPLHPGRTFFNAADNTWYPPEITLTP